MSEFIMSKIITSMPISEEDINLGKKPECKEVRCKVSLRDVQLIYPSDHENGTKGTGIDYHTGEHIFLVDDFERINNLHNEYLKGNKYEKVRLN